MPFIDKMSQPQATLTSNSHKKINATIQDKVILSIFSLAATAEGVNSGWVSLLDFKEAMGREIKYVLFWEEKKTHKAKQQ